MKEKKALTATLVRRYQRAGRKEKSKILDEFVATTGYNRSYARRILRLDQKRDWRKKKKKGILRKKVYDEQVEKYLSQYWAIGNYVCGKRLRPVLSEYIRLLERDNLLLPPLEIKEKLLSISPATIDRLLVGERRKLTIRGKSATRPGSLLKHQIPIRTYADWDNTCPGFCETDLVAFCGNTLRGEFCWGLNLTDVATGWVGLGAVWGKSAGRVKSEIEAISERLPFKLLGLDADNGSEFINVILLWYTRDNKITFTRNRAGQKNDNCFVEQKNYTVLRTFVGYQRLDKFEQLKAIEELLRLVEIYVNFFQASTKLVSKHRQGAKVSKQHDKGLTPYQRLCRSGILNKTQRKRLHRIYNQRNPMELKQKIESLQSQIWSQTSQLPRARKVTKLAEATNTRSVTF